MIATVTSLPPKRFDARKPSDQTLVSSTTLINDTHLVAPIGANETWVFDFVLYATYAAGGQIKVAVTTPSGATQLIVAEHTANGIVTTTGQTTTSGTGLDMTVAAATAGVLNITATVANGSTAGNVTLQWAQATSSGTATVVKANSSLRGRAVATPLEDSLIAIPSVSALWLANRGASLVGSKVSYLPDLSGNGNNAVQGTDANRPTSLNTSTATLGNQYSIRYTGAGLFLRTAAFAVAISQPYTIIMCGILDGDNNGHVMFSDDGSTGSHVQIVYAANNALNIAASTSQTSANSTFVQTSPWVVSVTFNGASSNAWVNGTQVLTNVNAGANALSGATIGGNYDGTFDFIDGNLYACMIVGGSITTGNRQTVERTLATLCGFRGSVA